MDSRYLQSFVYVIELGSIAEAARRLDLTPAAVATFAIIVAVRVWPAAEETDLPHAHDDLAAGDPHLAEGAGGSGKLHSHAYVVDDQHPRWPS